MRLAERNDLRESEGQQVARYLEGLKPQINHMTGVQVMRNLYETKNIALKDEFMMQDQELMSLLEKISVMRTLRLLMILR